MYEDDINIDLSDIPEIIDFSKGRKNPFAGRFKNVIKRIILTVVFFVMISISQSVYALTEEEAVLWANAQIGEWSWFSDGTYSGQCTALISKFTWENFGFSLWFSPKDFASIVVSASSDTWVTIDQNVDAEDPAVGTVAKLVTRDTYALVSGVLRPPYNGKSGHQIPAPTVSMSGDTIIINEGEMANFSVTFNGIAPLKLVYREGSEEKTFNLYTREGSRTGTTAGWWFVNPSETTEYTLVSVEDSSFHKQKVALSGSFLVYIRTNQDEIITTVDGKILELDVPPQTVNNRTLVPLRAIFEGMGAVVDWQDDTQTVFAKKGNTVVKLTIGNTSPTVNGVTHLIDQPGIVIDGRTYVPLRFAAEAFGGSVDWDPAARIIHIKSLRK